MTGAGVEYAVKGVHNNLQRLGKGLISLAFGFIVTMPDLADDIRQTMIFPREAGTEKTGDAVPSLRLVPPGR